MDVQKTMEFILEQQAAATVMITRLTEAQYNTEQNVNRLDETMTELGASLNLLAGFQARADARLDRLEEVVEETSQGLRHLGAKVDALVAVVDSLVRRPNG